MNKEPRYREGTHFVCGNVEVVLHQVGPGKFMIFEVGNFNRYINTKVKCNSLLCSGLTLKQIHKYFKDNWEPVKGKIVRGV